MSLRVVTPFVNTNIPDSYPNITVQSNPVGLGSSGIVVLIGEADGGDSYENVVLKNNIFTPDQLDKVQRQYVGGQIVEAFRAMSAPSADADIVGSANLIYIVKTNQGAKASAIVDVDYGTLSDQNWGLDGNKYKYQITSIAAESAPAVSGNTIATFGAPLNGTNFSIRLSGGAIAVVTLSVTPGDHSDIATLIVELNALLPAGIVASLGTAASSLKLTMDVDATAYRKGWGKSFELVDSTPGDLAALGLSDGLYVSSQEPGVEVSIVRPDTGLSETLDVNALIALSVGYQGTTGTMTISAAGVLTTAVAGGPGAALTIQMSDYRTIADLASFIDSQTGYSASFAASAQQLPPSALDVVAAINIASTGASLLPGRVKKASYDFQAVVGTSRGLSFAPLANGNAGLPSTMVVALYLAGGARGATNSADIISTLSQISGIQCNIVVPLFSQDATDDIILGSTDSASNYTIAAINAAVKSHCIQFSTPKLKRNRMAILSLNSTYGNAKSMAQSLGQYRVSLTMQRVTQVDSQGVVQTYMPWYASCVAAGMQAGGFYKAIVNKAANVISFIDPSGFDSGSPGDNEDALSAGLLFMSRDTTRNYWVSDQTTYGFDTNFVYNSIQAVYCSDILALDLAQSFKLSFVGKSLADVDASTGKSFVATKMDGYRKLKLIAGSTDAPLGFKNVKVDINGPEMNIAVEVKLATAIYFIPISINISQVQSSA